MSTTSDPSPPPYKRIRREKEAYLEELPEPGRDWPPDVIEVYVRLSNRLFEMGLQAQEVVESSDVADNNICGRFRYLVGKGMKEWTLHNRLRLAKRLLANTEVTITSIAFAVGYQTPSGFSATFKRREGCSPSQYRAQQRQG